MVRCHRFHSNFLITRRLLALLQRTFLSVTKGTDEPAKFLELYVTFFTQAPIFSHFLTYCRHADITKALLHPRTVRNLSRLSGRASLLILGGSR